MKILHTVESYYPSSGGMQEVVKQLSERLTLWGHDVTVATSTHPSREKDTINGVQIKSFDISGNFIRGLQGDVSNYRNFLLHSKYDVVVNFAAQQWATDIALPILPQIKSKKVFVPTGFSGFYHDEYKQYFEQMKSWMRGYDMNVFLSNDYRDINFARANEINNIVLIPNGAGEDEFSKKSYPDIRRRLNISKDAFLVLHVGSYSGLKGQDEACEIYIKSKLRNSVILFIGNNTELLKKKFFKTFRMPYFFRLLNGKNKRVIIRDDLSRTETVAAYLAADLFLFPSNVECSPIVLFECAASKTPFLTTDVGNSKEIISWSKGGLLLPTVIDEKGYSHSRINESVSLLNEIYNKPEKRESLCNDGFKAWKEKFTWEIIAKQYESLYKNLVLSNN